MTMRRPCSSMAVKKARGPEVMISVVITVLEKADI